MSPMRNPRRQRTSSRSPPRCSGSTRRPRKPFDPAAMSEMSRSFYEDNRRIRIDKLKREAGFRPLYPTYREGLRALAASGEGQSGFIQPARPR